MRIAVSSDDTAGLDGLVSSHFGRCPYYTLLDVTEGRVETVQVVANPHYPNHVPGVVPQFIHDQGANVMVTGGMGHRAIGFFDQLGIQAVTGASGTVRGAVAAYVRGDLTGAAPCRDSEHDCGDDAGHGEHGSR